MLLSQTSRIPPALPDGNPTADPVINMHSCNIRSQENARLETKESEPTKQVRIKRKPVERHVNLVCTGVHQPKPHCNAGHLSHNLLVRKFHNLWQSFRRCCAHANLHKSNAAKFQIQSYQNKNKLELTWQRSPVSGREGSRAKS